MTTDLRKDQLEASLKKADNAFKSNQFETAIFLYEFLIVRLEVSDLILRRLSVSYYRTGDFEQAVKYQRLLLDRTQDDGDAFALGLVLLRLGELSLADPYYQKRKMIPDLVRVQVPGVPLWRGQTELKGKTIMLVKEQGCGDLIQFCRYASALVKMGANVLHWVHDPLRELMRHQQGLGRVLDKDEKVGVHYHAYYLDLLPYIPLLESYLPSKEAAYLIAPNNTAQSVVNKIELNGLRQVGLFWSGSKSNQRDKQRSINLDALRPLVQSATGKKVNFYSLSNDSKQREIDASGLNIIDLAEQINDFADLAWAISQMDLVISIDSAGAHLAGAMGCPVIMMIDLLCDWRWKLDRSWYDSMTIYQQQEQGQWQSVIDMVNTDFSKRL